jgi:hypothetical protein
MTARTNSGNRSSQTQWSESMTKYLQAPKPQMTHTPTVHLDLMVLVVLTGLCRALQLHQ